MECEAAAGSVATEATVEIVLADAAPAEASAARPAQEAEDNMTVFADSEDECRDCDTEGTTDEEGGQQAMDLALHFARIRAMGLLVPPLPQPLQESRRQFLRRVKKKNKKKSWKRRQGLACKSRAAPSTHRDRWAPGPWSFVSFPRTWRGDGSFVLERRPQGHVLEFRQFSSYHYYRGCLAHFTCEIQAVLVESLPKWIWTVAVLSLAGQV